MVSIYHVQAKDGFQFMCVDTMIGTKQYNYAVFMYEPIKQVIKCHACMCLQNNIP